MAVDIDNDILLEEDEDIKIWRGTAAEEYQEDETDTEEKRSRDSGKHKKSSNGTKKKNKKTAVKGNWLKIFSGEKVISIVPSAVAIILLAAAKWLPLEGWKLALFYFIPFTLAGFSIARAALNHVLNVHILEKECVTFLAAVLAFASGSYNTAVIIFVVLTSLGYIEKAIDKKKKKTIKDIRNVCAGKARVETLEGLQMMGPEFVNIGDMVHVYPDEQISVDGIVKSGITSIDASPLTGSAGTIPVNVGYKVYAGTINVTAPIVVEATEVYGKSTASDYANLVKSASDDKAQDELLVEKYSAYYKYAMLVIGILIAVVPAVMGHDAKTWLCRAAVIIALSSPGAAAITVPFAYFGGTAKAAKDGIIFKGTRFINQFATAETMVFDKTGIITEGRYEVKEVFPVGMTEEQLLSIAATAEQYSDHPIAKALKHVGEILDTSGEKVLEIQEIPGKGISAFIGGKHVYVGNAALLEDHGVKYAIPSRPGAAVHVALDSRYCGHILITDKIRRGAFETLDTLKLQGIQKTIMLTGDVLSVSRPIANKLNFDMLRAEQTPDDKAAAVAYLTDNCPINRALVFIGDGVSDALAMSKADIGISMNALGNDAAIESAGIAILNEEIAKLPTAFRISKDTSLIVLENIIAAIAVKFILIALTIAGLLPSLAAVIIDAVLFAAAALNAWRASTNISINIKFKRGK